MALSKLTKVQTLGIGSNIEVVGVITTGQFKSGTSNLHSSGVELTNLNVSGIATIGGNVSIGGTLTYQDVTNIDSVGLITARSGINVSGGTATFAGDLSIADKIIHTGDTNTAIRFPAADTFSVETAGSERLRIASDGNMGLGTNSLVGNAANVYLTVNGSTLGGIALKANGTTQGYLQGTSSLIRLSSDGSKPITFDTNGSERLRIDAGGGMQLGTSTATASKLTVYGANDAAAIFQGSGTGTGAANGFLVGNNGGTDGLLWNYENGNTKIATNNVERLRITSDGKLIKGHASNIGQIRTQFQTHTQLYGSSNSTGLKIGTFSNDPYAGNLEFVKSRSATIGTNTLVQNGDNLGSIYWGAADGSQYQPAAVIAANMDGSTGTNDIPTRLTFYTAADGANGPTERLKITSTGQVRIDQATSANNGIRMRPSGWNYDFRIGAVSSSGGSIWLGQNYEPTGGTRDSASYGTNYIQFTTGGTIHFGTGATNTNPTARMNISSEGYVTKPYMPIASVSSSHAVDLTNVVLTSSNFYNTTYVNQGSHFNASTGRFTCPVAGVYRIYFRATCSQDQHTNVRLRKNGNTINEAYANHNTGESSSDSSEAVINCSANDYLEIQVSRLKTLGGAQHKQVTFQLLH